MDQAVPPAPDAHALEASLPPDALQLALPVFTGSLDLLLLQARAHRVDLGQIALPLLMEQLDQAVRAATVPLSRKADWLVATSWLLLLRSALALPAEDPRQQAAQDEAATLQARLVALEEARALAQWLQARPQLGRDLFARGRAEPDVLIVAPQQGYDRVEFLWGCIALFEGDRSQPPEALAVYAPKLPEVYTVETAQARVRQRLERARPNECIPLHQLIPEEEQRRPLEEREAATFRTKHRSGWTSTLMACLEMTKQGAVGLEQSDQQTILVRPSRDDMGLCRAPV